MAAEEDINGKRARRGHVRHDEVRSDHDMKRMAESDFRAWGEGDILVNNAMNMRLRNTIMRSTMASWTNSTPYPPGRLLAIKEFVRGCCRKHGVRDVFGTASIPHAGAPASTGGKAAPPT